ncbi:hypothetical protein AcV5_003797 [Taiwanofungus camphoratus]|nr:hypothetical protein AcV5_003797 [Antrodia cinnamomea]
MCCENGRSAAPRRITDPRGHKGVLTKRAAFQASACGRHSGGLALAPALACAPGCARAACRVRAGRVDGAYGVPYAAGAGAPRAEPRLPASAGSGSSGAPATQPPTCPLRSGCRTDAPTLARVRAGRSPSKPNSLPRPTPS